MTGELVVNHGETRVSPVESSELLLSCMIAIVAVLMLSTSVGPAIVKPLLLDGSLISNGRFAFVFDAYETVGDDEVPSVVGIGSSILLAAMNGTCMQDESNVANARFYNFAMPGDKPYTEMVQIPMLIEANPDVVMLEVGPNGLYGWNENHEPRGNSDYNQFRFRLMSMGASPQHIGDWYDVLDQRDRGFIETSILEKADAWGEYVPEAIEEHLQREFTGISSANYDDNSYRNVPHKSSEEWTGYLSEPNYHISRYEGKSSEFIQDDLDRRMPDMIAQGYYSPQANGTQNHRALDYIIHELLNASIDVVLIGLPHHPWVNGYLESGQLDNVNDTFLKFENLEGVVIHQMYWDDWPIDAFDDRLHMDGDGRALFCERITPIVDMVLEKETR